MKNLLTLRLPDFSGAAAALGAPIAHPYTVDFPVTAACRNIRAFHKLHEEYNLKEAPKETYIYEPIAEPISVFDFPLREDRKYALDEAAVKLQHLPYPHPNYADDHENYPGGAITYWSLLVKDTSDESSEVLKLFTIPASGERFISWSGHGRGNRVAVKSDHPFAETGAITHVIASRKAAIELGKITCDIMNRFPYDIDWTDMQANNRISIARVRLFIERTALWKWRPDFDYRQLPKLFYDRDTTGNPAGHYSAKPASAGKGIAEASGNSMEYLHHNVAAFPHFPVRTPGKDNFNFKYTFGETEVSVLEDIDMEQYPSVPEGYWFQASPIRSAHEANDPRVSIANRIVENAVYQTAGLIGSSVAIRQRLRGLCTSFTDEITLGTSRMHSGASRDATINRNQTPLILDGVLDGKRVLGSAHAKQGSTMIKVSTLAWALMGAQVPYTQHAQRISITSLRGLHAAYVKYKVLDAFRHNVQFSSAIFAGYKAADQVNLAMISDDDICLEMFGYGEESESQDQDLNDQLRQARETTEQPCTCCASVVMVSQMTRFGAGESLCHKCKTRQSRLGRLPVFHSGIEGLILQSLNRLKRDDPKLDVKNALKQLMDAHVTNKAGLSYNDGYADTVDDLTAVVNLGPGVAARLDMVSVDKPFQAMRFEHDTEHDTALHSTKNIILCRLLFNMFKGSSIPALMGWAQPLLELATEAEKQSLPVSVEYHEIEKELLEAWDAAALNAHLITTKLPFRNDARQALDLSTDQWGSLRKELMSGVWNGELADGQLQSREPRNRQTSRFFHLGPPPVPSKWTAEQIATINKNIDDMEKSPIFNPHGLKLERGPGGVPYLWPLGTLPPDFDYDFVDLLFLRRLDTMRCKCNRHHATNESSATLLLLYVVWWLQTAGKCHMFRFKLVIWSRHDACFSFGRAKFHFDKDGQEDKTKPIVAGTAMSSGFTKLMPTDIHRDFSWTEMTVVAESWKANVCRYSWPVAAIPHIIERLMKVSLSREGSYEARKDKAAYTGHPFPPINAWKSSQSLDSTDDRIVELDNDEENDEEAAYNEIIRSREAPAEEDQLGGAGGIVADDTSMPSDTSMPGDTAMPGGTSKPVDTSKPSDASKPSAASKPIETSSVRAVKLSVGVPAVTPEGQEASSIAAWTECVQLAVKDFCDIQDNYRAQAGAWLSLLGMLGKVNSKYAAALDETTKLLLSTTMNTALDSFPRNSFTVDQFEMCMSGNTHVDYMDAMISMLIGHRTNHDMDTVEGAQNLAHMYTMAKKLKQMQTAQTGFVGEHLTEKLSKGLPVVYRSLIKFEVKRSETEEFKSTIFKDAGGAFVERRVPGKDEVSRYFAEMMRQGFHSMSATFLENIRRYLQNLAIIYDYDAPPEATMKAVDEAYQKYNILTDTTMTGV
jgi:hypothetical protein